MNHRPRKRFGQNFLRDTSIIEKISDVIDPGTGQQIIEIGPGAGAITRPLVESGAEVVLVELDRDLAAELESVYADNERVTVVAKDFLDVNISDLFQSQHRVRVVGNLPYNVSTPIMFHLMDQRKSVEDLHIMLQKELVDRIASQSGRKTYGRLSVVLQRWFDITVLFNVPPGAFFPRPKVTSSMVRLIPRSQPQGGPLDETWFQFVVKKAFEQRRKTLRRALRGLVSEQSFRAADIDPQSRAENLAVVDFSRLVAHSHPIERV